MIKITPHGIPETKAYIDTIERGIKAKATGWVVEYLVGDQTHGLKHYSPYRYVPYAKAYGGFKSDKQRRYVFAMIKEGRIDPGYPHRTGEFQRAWTYKVVSSGRFNIVNPTSYGEYLVSDTGQARLSAMAGWRKIGETIKANWNGAIRYANARIAEWLKEAKRK